MRTYFTQYASTPRKEKRVEKRKGIEAQRVRHPTPCQATDALTGDEEQNGKQKRTKKKETRSWSPTQQTIQSPPTTRRDPTVSLFILLPR